MSGEGKGVAQSSCFLSILTPTYNRAHTLHRVHDSLLCQAEPDIEWLVVDCESTDGTAELIEAWSRSAPFPIRFLQQPRRSKASAVNFAAPQVRGELVTILDSDDALTDGALRLIRQEWSALAAEQRSRLAGLLFTCVDETGALVAPPFPRERMVCNSLDMIYRHRAGGERQGVQRAELLLDYPLPEGDAHIPMSVTWSRLARDYDFCCVNEPIRVYHVYDTGPRITGQRRPTKNFLGKREWMRAKLDYELPWFRYAPASFCDAAVQYVRASLHCGHSLGKQFADLRSPAARAFWMAAVPFGYGRYLRDRRRKP
jgi:glycosyltransferase involved in cell wall biosynthesis